MRSCLAALALSLCSAGGAARAADPDALWKIVAGACIPHQADGGGGAPCALVDLAKGYVVLKDRVGATQFLVMPTAKRTGIESPELLADDALPYWSYAWEARAFVAARAGRNLARDEISLAINAISGRSQNQLHIHVDCIRMDVRDALRAQSGMIGVAWAPLATDFNGHRYVARRIDGATLGDRDPFKLAAEGLPDARLDMGHVTLVLTGAVFAEGREGFVLMADRAGSSLGDRASGEELQDHDCALAHVTP